MRSEEEDAKKTSRQKKDQSPHEGINTETSKDVDDGGSEEEDAKKTSRPKEDNSSSFPQEEIEFTSWRDFYLDDRWIQRQWDDLKNVITRPNFRPAGLGGTKGKIVLLGPAGHGKSSFINSVISIALRRIPKVAQDGSSCGSMTLAYNEFVCDNLLVTSIEGIEAGDGFGFNIGDIMYLLKGNIEKKYKFDQDNPITQQSPDFIPNPSLADRVHCVILCLNATELANIKPEDISKIQTLHDAANKLHIQLIMILTNIDNLLGYVKEPVRSTNNWDIVQKAVNEAREIVTIPEKYIHPVQNFTRENSIRPLQSILLLRPLKQALELAKDHIDLIQTKGEAL